MSTTGGKAYLMVLNDILRLSKTEEYASHPKQKPEELATGFRIPPFMLNKMQRFMADVQTDPNVPDDVLLEEAKDHVSRMEGLQLKKTVKTTNRKATNVTKRPNLDTDTTASVMSSIIHATTDEDDVMLDDAVSAVNDTSEVTGGTCEGDEDEDDDLGSFLHGVNLTSLVREFENAASDGANLMSPQHLDGILSLAADDDDVDQGQTPFPELPDPPDNDDVEDEEGSATEDGGGGVDESTPPMDQGEDDTKHLKSVWESNH